MVKLDACYPCNWASFPCHKDTTVVYMVQLWQFPSSVTTHTLYSVLWLQLALTSFESNPRLGSRDSFHFQYNYVYVYRKFEIA